jgi:hypothetical protein
VVIITFVMGSLGTIKVSFLFRLSDSTVFSELKKNKNTGENDNKLGIDINTGIVQNYWL